MKSRGWALFYASLSFAGMIYGGNLIASDRAHNSPTAQSVPVTPIKPVALVQPWTEISQTTPPTASRQEQQVQEKFRKVMADIRKFADGMSNDMQRADLLPQRNRLLCMSDLESMIDRADSTGDGGAFEIRIGPYNYVKTWNNSFFVMFDHTLVEPTSVAFQQGAVLSTGQAVIFSGRFRRDNAGDAGACLRETSRTSVGELDEPEYLFYFDAIRPR